MELKHENIFKYLLVCFIISIVGLTATFLKIEASRNAPSSTATVADSAATDVSEADRVPSSVSK